MSHKFLRIYRKSFFNLRDFKWNEITLLNILSSIELVACSHRFNFIEFASRH